MNGEPATRNYIPSKRGANRRCTVYIHGPIRLLLPSRGRPFPLYCSFAPFLFPRERLLCISRVFRGFPRHLTYPRPRRTCRTREESEDASCFWSRCLAGAGSPIRGDQKISRYNPAILFDGRRVEGERGRVWGGERAKGLGDCVFS